MQTTSWLLLVGTAIVAAIDWWAVSGNRRSCEWFFKPFTMVVLAGVLWTLDLPDGPMRRWWTAALIASMIGDIFLIRERMSWFIPGVVAFLLAHVAYVAGFLDRGVNVAPLLAGVALMAILLLSLGPTILASAHAEHPALPFGLGIYVLTIAVMVCCAWGSGSVLAAVGATLFAISDGVIGFTKFVQALPYQRLIIIVTYHVAQALLVLSLLQLR